MSAGDSQFEPLSHPRNLQKSKRHLNSHEVLSSRPNVRVILIFFRKWAVFRELGGCLYDSAQGRLVTVLTKW